MAARSKAKGTLKQNYDKLALILILLGLIASAVILISQIGSVKSALEAAEHRIPKAEPASTEEIDVMTYKPFLAALTKPPQVGDYDPPIFSLPRETPVDPCSLDKDGDGIDDCYEADHKLDPLDPGDAELDHDEDTFSTLEEYRSNTDPFDSLDFPSAIAKLRLIRITIRRFELLFQGVNELADGIRFQFNSRTTGKTYFKKMGEEVEGFNIINYEKKEIPGVSGSTAATDVSVLTLQQADTQIKLVKGETAVRPERTAHMVLLIDETRYRGRIDDTITLKDVNYKVIDIKREKAILRDEKGNDFDIGRPTQADRALLRGASEAAPPGRSLPAGMPPPGTRPPRFGTGAAGGRSL